MHEAMGSIHSTAKTKPKSKNSHKNSVTPAQNHAIAISHFIQNKT
jgi:hypothetical protein